MYVTRIRVAIEFCPTQFLESCIYFYHNITINIYILLYISALYQLLNTLAPLHNMSWDVKTLPFESSANFLTPLQLSYPFIAKSAKTDPLRVRQGSREATPKLSLRPEGLDNRSCMWLGRHAVMQCSWACSG